MWVCYVFQHQPDEVVPLTHGDDEAVVWTPSHVVGGRSGEDHDDVPVRDANLAQRRLAGGLESVNVFLNDEMDKLLDLPDRFHLDSLSNDPVPVPYNDIIEACPESPSDPYISEKRQFNEDDFSSELSCYLSVIEHLCAW